jgi:hypothetical protein
MLRLLLLLLPYVVQVGTFDSSTITTRPRTDPMVLVRQLAAGQLAASTG